MSRFTESVVEDAALDWLERAGWVLKGGAEISPGEVGAERVGFDDVLLRRCLRVALVRLNQQLPAESVDDALRKLTLLPGATLEDRNRALHRLLVDGVGVEYRTPAGDIRGAQARVIDFDAPENNDW